MPIAAPVSAKVWIAGARPRTLPAAVVPVVVGTAAAVGLVPGGLIWWRAVAALIVAVALQVGTNYANDYSDGIRGTDHDKRRIGPVRLVGQGLARPGMVKRAAFGGFGVAGLAGLALTIAVGWQLLIVGAAAIAAGWFYTGGPRPYGYAGFGEVFVFVFFGVVATVGSTYVQVGHLTALAFAASLPVGLLATALLVTNNLRDIPGDTASGKRTLAVRIGDGPTRWLYILMVEAAIVSIGVLAFAAGRHWVLLGVAGGILAVRPIIAVRDGAKGRSLIAVLADTGRAQLACGALLAVGLALSG
ncbi:MAG: 1,4-dihydroxy-2-naphthoate polyprenyltransferase [Acidimicrobiales bacterium]